MTWVVWTGSAIAALIAVAWALRLAGGRRWASAIQARTTGLRDAGWQATAQAPNHKCHDQCEPDGLPAPVQCHFAAVPRDGQPTIAEVNMLPWDCRVPDDEWHGGMLLPMTGEAAWIRPEGRKACFVGHVMAIDHALKP